ncbi:MAG: GNAT family N-acetyltransferase [Pseudolabrys sp.]|nr:GNAT family N-acetyltransferase [Pseudolabrys sp.]
MTALHAPPVFSLPAALLSQGYRLRPETDADIPFLMQVYASTRAYELESVPWSDAQKQAFIAHQFNAQRHHYRTSIPACVFQVIEHQGAGIGRLYLEPRETMIYIVDIALLPEHCGRGLGTAILRALQATAGGGGGGGGVNIMVEKLNPALRFYQRLGFTDVADHDVYLEMEWMPRSRRTSLDN